ncbi:hypothetical protein [Sinomicrobium sp. M5D2P17]
MKKTIVLVLFFLISCNQTKKNSEYFTSNTNIRKEVMKNIYYINYNFTFPFELIVNDMVIAKEMRTGMAGPERINHFILENGEQSVRIKIFAPKDYNNGLLKQKDLNILEEQSAIYKVNSETNDFDTVMPLKFDKIDQEVPYIEKEWKFNADLPFKLKGWEKSEDLTQWDKEELEKTVIEKFQELHDQLNFGKVDSFMKEIEAVNNEVFIANYFDEDKKKDYINNLLEIYESYKGNMLPISKYKIRILGDGRAVALERVDNKYLGQGVLVAENKDENQLYLNYIVLHKPKDSKDLRIVRINSLITSLN